MRYLSVILIGLAAIGCNRTNDQTSRFHEDGRAKPSVAIATMLDTTSFDVPWSLSEELTAGVMNLIKKNGQIYVHTQEESPFTENPFGTDLSWMKREFNSEEFVAFLELVEHEFIPTQSSQEAQDTSNNLIMAVRLRVIDLRPTSPKVVLQELVKESYFVPKSLIPTDYSYAVWGTQDYTTSPMHIAHTGLAKQIASRISDYVLLAKSR